MARVNGAIYHLQNVALLPWYTESSEGLGSAFSFPDAQALTEAAKPCPARGRRLGGDTPMSAQATSEPIPLGGPSNSHQLIGYWVGYGAAGSAFPIREVSPQWDVIIVAFSRLIKIRPKGPCSSTRLPD